MVRWLLLGVLVVTCQAHFQCPEMTSFCTCDEDTAWWTIDNDYIKQNIVNCSFNMLTEVPDLSSLKGKLIHRLLLNNNNISHISRKQFSGLTVKEINVRRNPLKRIPTDVFEDVKDHLQILDMDSVRLKIDQGLAFLRGLYNLKVLDLGYNQLTTSKYKTMSPGIFDNLNLTSLRTLTLQALQMEMLEVGAFLGIEHLEQLDLSFNYFSEFPSELRTLPHLKDLKLYTNELQILKNNTFSGMTSLRKLLIGVNEIDTIESGAFNDVNSTIEEIDLYHNPLSYVPTEAISVLTNLEKLSLIKTQLRSLENGSFWGDYSLKELRLDDNPGLDLNSEGIFAGIEDSLEVLFIRTLNLHTLPVKALGSLKKLFYLDANDNKIKTINKHFFHGLHKLSHVNLMWNKIKHIDYRAFRHLKPGVILNLHNNDLSDISFILNVTECTFRDIDVSANSIPCDCTLETILHSGVVEGSVIGYCYMESEEGAITWHHFSDATLVDQLIDTCNATQQYASCVRAESTVGGANCLIFSLVTLVASIVSVIFTSR